MATKRQSVSQLIEFSSTVFESRPQGNVFDTNKYKTQE